jgi:chromosome segregation ATPase
MEQSVRSAKSEARELAEQLQIQREGREAAMKKIEGLEKEVKSLKDELASARKGETLSKKLEGDLVNAKEESEKQRLSNLGLEQQLKELREENKSLKKEVEDAKAGAALESERESTKLKKERDDMLGDLESKLRTSEREANVREDALRHEVSELRKRWQDAVRRAEGKSIQPAF